MEDYVILSWLEVLDIINEEGFNNNATPIVGNDKMGIEEDSYLVRKKWLDSFHNND